MSQTDADLRRILERAKTIAVLGAHPDASRPAHYVPLYLHSRGLRVLPVNSQFPGQTLWGSPVRATLAELGEPIDVVDVFRRADHLAAHVPDILAMKPLPRVVWFQSGIENDAVAAELARHGIEVVQDRCLMVDHRRLGG